MSSPPTARPNLGRGSRGLYEAIFDAAPDALLLVDQEANIFTANAPAEKLFGFSREELHGSPLDRLIPERFRAVHETHVRGFLAAPHARPMGVGLDLWARRKDGTEVPVEISLSPVQTEQGMFVAAAIRDISQRRAAEQALRESDERFRLLVEGAHEYALFMLDPEGRVASWNPGAERLKGSPAADALGQPIARFYPPEDVAAGVPQAILQLATERGYSVEEGWRLRADGSRFWATVVTTALRDDRGRLRGFAKLVRDETERQLAMRDRERALRWLRTVIESVPVGLLLFEGPSGEHVEANSYAVQMFGRPIDAERGSEQYRHQVHHADGRPVGVEELPSHRALRGQTIEAGEELLLRRPDGRDVPILVSAAPVFDDEGRVAGAVVAFDDISTMKNVERLREEWTSIVAHDLRQPLNVIATHAALLGRRRTEDEQVTKATSTIAANAKRLDRMIHDLLDLSRLEAAKLRIERRPIDVEKQVRAAADRAATVAEGHRVLVGVHGALPAVSADPDRLDQILDNLLSNALRYGDPDADVTIDVEGAPNQVDIAVTNRGGGISAEVLPHLFERFRRDASHVSQRESIGLGLYIARGLVEAHGGHIEVTSTPGKTTTFRFTLPAAA